MKNIQYWINFKDFTYNDTFIETGTCAGATTQLAVDAGYSKILTVELSDYFYNLSKDKFKNHQHVHLYHGKSTDNLWGMMVVSKESQTVFLDAHPAGEQTAGHADLMEKGSKSEFFQHNIIMQELDIISKHPVKTHTIIIDDQLHEPDRVIYKDFILKNISPDYHFYMLGEKLDNGQTNDKILLCVPFEVEIVGR